MKIERAAELARELSASIERDPPFRYTLEFDTQAMRMSVGPRENQASIARVALLAGDAVHNLRTALDHVCWSALCSVTDPKQHRRIQFPFADDQQRFERLLVEPPLTNAPAAFLDELRSLRPYAGGADNLYSLNKLDIVDKHRLFIPVGNFKQVETGWLRTRVPELPRSLGGIIKVGNCGDRDIAWRARSLAGEELSRAGMRPVGIGQVWERTIDVPVTVTLRQEPFGLQSSIGEDLMELCGTVREAVQKLLKSLAFHQT